MSVADCRKLDELATTQYAIPSIVLMENAAIGLCAHAIEMLESARSGVQSARVHIATGPGNNAGDGFALARHLSNAGYEPMVIMATPSEKIVGDAKINLDIITKMNLPIINAEHYLAETQSTPALFIDALFGTGLSRPITGIANTLIQHINQCRKTNTQVLAVDVPSGLDAQTGTPLSETVIIADRTVTFAALKDGFRTIEAQPYLGEVSVASIGVPLALILKLGTQVHPAQDKPHNER